MPDDFDTVLPMWTPEWHAELQRSPRGLFSLAALGQTNAAPSGRPTKQQFRQLSRVPSTQAGTRSWYPREMQGQAGWHYRQPR
ncbi:MAG: hypothetical protein JWR32_3292 [Mycobacterium sp.]|jgi:hypothetical protein|nr:hypothetical protein [Mycobacterium sp.]